MAEKPQDAAAKQSSQSDDIRSSIERQMEQEKEKRKIELFKKRIEVARSGIHFYSEQNYKDAVKNFMTYLRALEEYKKVPENGLSPKHFDKTADLQEMLLISGIYYDLAKLYDKTRSTKREQDMRLFMDKFVEFTKGQPYQHVCAENLRKYLAGGKAHHRSVFNASYKKIKPKGCFIATELQDDLRTGTLDRLRAFRDDVLEPNRVGQVFANFYYDIGPEIARVLARHPDCHVLRKVLGSSLDLFSYALLPILKISGVRSRDDSAGK